MTFDGPGQQAALFLQKIPFRHDWEAVLTPVVDAMIARARRRRRSDRRDRREPGRVLGAARARVRAPLRGRGRRPRRGGRVDLVDGEASRLHEGNQLGDPEKASFDQEMGWTRAVLEVDPRDARTSAASRTVSKADSRFDLYQEVLKYRLGDEVKDITTPLLITEPEDEQFWPGQSQQLYDWLPGDEAAGRVHRRRGRQPALRADGPRLRDARIFDWLANHLHGA